ncbi:tetratricopeptide repeat protein [uncultured Halomonas sp.]|uniref:tetratricopeptide repeat protein n=1 Tax=uncultured Halomonas sp. TaxID=173971 RepID=UPI00259213F3|nr:tetratricopeptide repeat protein [uncultured Halomonas sp.]
MPHYVKKISIILFLTCAAPCLTACDESSTFNFMNSRETTFTEMEGTPYFIANNPDRYALADFYDNTSVEQLLRGNQNGDTTAKFLLGLIYAELITGYEEYVDRSQGLPLVKESWKMGVVDAGSSLFTAYNWGIGTRINKPLALAYLQASAEKGYILSQKRLGFAYLGSDPRGLVEQDIQQARIWFTRAAEQGDAESATQLAGIYQEGIGVPKDERAAFEWLKRAEHMPFNGFLSHRGLANYYEKGIGTEVDLVQAYKYFDLQGTAGVPDKKRLEAQMTPEQVQQAIALSRAWQEENRTFFPSYYGLEHQSDGSYR